MNCRAYSTAAAYNLKSLFEKLKEHTKPTLYRDVIHMSVHSEKVQGDVFYFSYGALVCWGLSSEACQYYFDLVKKFESQPHDEVEIDEFTLAQGDLPKIIEEEIILPSHDTLSLLAVSHALAQSVKLGSFENTLKKTFDSTKFLPEHLATYGSIPLSRKEIRCKMGKLFIERNSINLHLEVLDPPEFFWDNSDLEPLYAMTANYLDLKTRVEVLNHRLNVVHELFQMLGNELNHQHSSRLEWTIIGLIVLEVVLMLLRDVFHLI
jgi:uncharacterized Rmd1/YagE family protein